MSARVLNPAMMTEMSRSLGSVIVASANSSVVNSSSPTTTTAAATSIGRVLPSRAALARVRRDLFGPVDHVAARALAERELKAQSILDAERWGFDFRLEVPKSTANSRFEWELVTGQDLVPEPYALRGMPYLRNHSPQTPQKQSPRLHRVGGRESCSPLSASPTRMLLEASSGSTTLTPNVKQLLGEERTPPQEARVPFCGEKTSELPDLAFRAKESSREQTGIPLLPAQTRKQAAITDFMKSRKRTLNGSTKSVIDPPTEKVARNAGQIRS